MMIPLPPLNLFLCEVVANSVPVTYSTTDILLRLAAGLVIGFCIGLTGVGGGVLVMPTLTQLLHMDAAASIGTASLYACMTKCSATLHYAKLKMIDYRTTLLVLLGAIPANMMTSYAINNFVATGDPESVATFKENLKLFIAGVVCAAVVIMASNLVQSFSHKGTGHKQTRLAIKLNKMPTAKNIIAPCLGILVGALIGATSIGGGVMIVPMLMLIFGLSAAMTVGTSVVIAVVLTFATAIVYMKGGNIDYGTAILMATGSMSGVAWGSKLAHKVPEKLLKSIMIVVILIAAIMMFTKSGGGH